MKIRETFEVDALLLLKLIRISYVNNTTLSQVVEEALEKYVDSIAVPDGTAIDAARPHTSTSDLTARMEKAFGRSLQYQLYPKDKLGQNLLSLAGKKRFASQEDANMWQYIISVLGDDLTFDELRKQFKYWREERHVSKYVAVKCVLRQTYKMAQEEDTAGSTSMMSEKEQSLTQVKNMYERLGFDVDNMDL